jgi:Ca2+-binding EF-hand superfamily protein
LYRLVYASLYLLLFASLPAASDTQKTKALVEARISEQPDLAESYEWLKEGYRLSVRGYAGQAFLRSADDILFRYVDDGVITAYEFDLAQQQAAEASYDDSIHSLLNRLTRGSADQIVLPFSLRKAAGQQAGRIKSEQLAKILALDLDGDWEIGRSEIDAQSLTDKRFKPESVLPYDLDGDGTITTPEITASIDADPNLGNPREAARMKALALLDLDRDDLVERGELRDFLELLETTVLEGRPGPTEELMRQAVIDGWAERGPWRSQNPPAEGPNCGTISPRTDQEFVFVSTYEGTSATNLALDGLADQTTVATVQVEPGDTEMFLLLASQSSVVWNLVGDVDRLSHVVVQRAGIDGARNAGVVGVPAVKVDFVPYSSCIKPITEPNEEPLAAAVIGPWVAWNRTPSMVVANYAMRMSFVPSGVVKSERSYPTSNFDLIVHTELFEPLGDSFVKTDLDSDTVSILRSYWASSRGAQDGIFFFKPGEVIVSGTEEFYPILPGTAGLIQLIKEGTLQVVKNNAGKKHLLLTKPIPNFPPDLDMWDNTRIDLAPGVPRPVGEPRGLTVYSIDESRCLTDVSCD